MKRTGRPPAARRARLLPLAAACALALAAAEARSNQAAAGGADGQLRRVCVGGACFDAEIAVTEAERAEGLMHRDALPSGRGMLFVFPAPGRHRFWMKDTRIELDILFIGPDRRVVDITHRAQPCRREPCETYGPAADAAYVLEIAGGVAGARGLGVGDLVEFRESPARP